MMFYIIENNPEVTFEPMLIIKELVHMTLNINSNKKTKTHFGIIFLLKYSYEETIFFFLSFLFLLLFVLGFVQFRESLITDSNEFLHNLYVTCIDAVRFIIAICHVHLSFIEHHMK